HDGDQLEAGGFRRTREATHVIEELVRGYARKREAGHVVTKEGHVLHNASWDRGAEICIALYRRRSGLPGDVLQANLTVGDEPSRFVRDIDAPQLMGAALIEGGRVDNDPPG